MKPFEKQIRTYICFIFLVGFLATNAVCSAQDETKPTSNPPRKPPARRFPAVVDKFSKHIFDVKFREPVSVDEFVAFLREETDHEINIVVSKDARKVMIPPIELKQVSIKGALHAMQVATQDEVTWNGIQEGLLRIQSDPGMAGMGAQELDDPNRILVSVVDVSKIVDQDDQAESSMLSAIEIGLEMNNSSPENVKIKFHKETKLLFIRAKQGDLDIVSQVLYEIDHGRPKTISELEEQIRKLKLLQDQRAVRQRQGGNGGGNRQAGGGGRR